MKNNLAKFILGLALVLGVEEPGLAQIAPGRFNDLIVEQVRKMPQGGRYSASRVATIRLQAAAHFESGKFFVVPDAASPSYCSGATYLVFIKTIEALRAQGSLDLDHATLERLMIRGQRDGEGIWGRWNANGPGTARLFHEMDLGRNFDDFDEAQPGDFMKIFWSPEVGRSEHGHSVIYLGTERKAGLDYVRFWSSNIPTGYGEKSVPRAKIIHAIFSRLDAPENLARAVKAPAVDKYLASLLSVRSNFREAKVQCGMSPR
ncbi:MAG TPA: hypothetical protein VGW39_07775 [Chthoniobacterales bacterium]|nr:hypothetical protein [Chthoniobacterales bacterium]